MRAPAKTAFACTRAQLPRESYSDAVARYLLVFLCAGIFDLYLLLVIGQWVGALPTIALVVATALVGGVLAKAEGLRVLRGWQEALAAGRVPEEGILDGVLVLAGGVLLILPGVLADVTGLALLTPPVRRVIAGFLRGRVSDAVARGSVSIAQNMQVVSFATSGFEQAADVAEVRDVLDVVGVVVDEESADADATRSPVRDIPRLGP